MPSLHEAVERHSHHYLSVAQQSATNWQVADTDVAQLRQAWEQGTRDTLDRLLPWARSLSSFYTLRGYWEEERTLKYRTLRAAQQVYNQRIEAWCLHELAYLAERQGH